MDFVAAIGIVLGLFWGLRKMEDWLHRHVFKVGWLVTKSYDTTTILYYTVFLPGVFLNQVTVWLVAGALDVRAERAPLGFPKKQEIGELKLDFVKLSRKASPVKLAFIGLMPLLIGLLVIWLIATQVFDVVALLAVYNVPDGGLGPALELLLQTPDFWLWAYFIFTVANTMMPDGSLLPPRRPLLILAAVALLLLWFTGLADDLTAALGPTVLNGLNGLSLLFGVVIAIDITALALLAAVETTIEIITGDSATFKNGKMIAMRREEVLKLRATERDKARKQQQAQKEQAALTASAGPPSVYSLALPIPGPPGTMPERTFVEPESVPELDKPRYRAPSVIETEVEQGAEAQPLPLFSVDRDRPDPDAEEDADDEAVPLVRPASSERVMEFNALTPTELADDDDEADEDVANFDFRRYESAADDGYTDDYVDNYDDDADASAEDPDTSDSL